MKRAVYFLILLVGLSGTTIGQHEALTKNWETVSLMDSSLGQIAYHMFKHKMDAHKPLIVYLQGSKNFPLYWPNARGSYSTSTTLDFAAISKDYHIVLISKPDIPFVDSLQITSSGRKYYPVTDAYRERYSLDWRVNAADKVIQNVLTKLKVDRSRIIVWGHSEGAQVAPAVAVMNDNVTHVVAMMGNSLNHLYDFILQERVAAMKGHISHEKAQANIDSLYAEYEKIYSDPASTTQTWYGETYYKWSSFTLQTPLENMLKLDIPILYVAGGKDHQSILNMDYAKLEFLRKGKANLTYKVFPNCDHFFMESRTDSSGKAEWIDHLNEVNDFALEWLMRN